MQVDSVMQAVMQVIDVRTRFFDSLGKAVMDSSRQTLEPVQSESPPNSTTDVPRGSNTGLKLDRRA